MDEKTFSASILYQTLVMAAICIVFLLVYTKGCKREVLMELRAPLIAEEALEHRVDAATREAEAGFVVCPACEFENFVRFTHCTICGYQLPSKQSQGNPASSYVELNARQLRARKRKTWTRRAGEDGTLRWSRDDSFTHARSTSRSPSTSAYVVRFKRPEESNAEDKLETIDDDLADEVSGLECELADATTADAGAFPTGFQLESIERVTEAVAIAKQDFPTKYAHFVVTTASLLVPSRVEFLKLTVNRDYVLEHSVNHLCCVQEKHMLSVMRINFLDESAVDAGGVMREWLMLLMERLVDPTLKAFICRNHEDQSYYLNPNSRHDVGGDHLHYYLATGRLIGRVLLEGSTWGFHLSPPLLKIILGQPISVADLEYFDPEIYKSMMWLLENDGVDALGLDFSVNERVGDEVAVVDLVPGGRGIDVTDANKHKFVDRTVQYLLVESVSTQLYALLKGIYDVIPQPLLMLFDVEEFDYLLCGTDEIDVDDWKRHTVNSPNLNGTRVFRWFWDEVEAMPSAHRRRLLLFATGSSRVPLGGFRGLTSHDGKICPFTLKGVSYYTNKYITSHSCFNRLDLPLYRSRDELQTMLHAIVEGEEYGFTIV